jgi:hypothetical protein
MPFATSFPNGDGALGDGCEGALAADASSFTTAPAARSLASAESARVGLGCDSEEYQKYVALVGTRKVK